jgi:sodium transport system ATP-binding protein
MTREVLMIEVRRLIKHYGPVRAVDGISFSCPDGMVTGLLGPNGAGKTTTLRVISTVLSPTAGTAMVDGHDVRREGRTVRSLLGVLPEMVGAYHRLTPREQLRYFGRLHGLRGKDLERRIKALIELMEMVEYADRRAGEFSKGMLQKLALARALIHDPPNLLLDEPTAGLDVMSARSVRGMIERFREEGRCVLLCTHVMSEAERLCDRIVIIHKGKILVQGTPDELRRKTGEEDLEEAFVKLVGEEALMREV